MMRGMFYTSLLTAINSAAWLVCFILCFWVKSAYGIGAALILLTGLIGWMVRDKAPLPSSARYWVMVLGIYFGVMLAISLYLQQPIKSYDRLSRYLFAIPIVFSLWWFRPSEKVLHTGIILGAVAAFVYVVYVKLWLQLPEIEQHRNINHILFSNITMLMAIMSGFLAYHFRRLSVPWICAIFGAFCGIAGAVLGGGRGAWLMLFPAIFIYGLAAKREQQLRSFLIDFAVILLLIGIIACIPQFHLLAKITAIFHDVSQYDAGYVYTSQGGRLEMWRCSTRYMLSERLWLGWGDVGLVQEKARLIAAGLCDTSIDSYTHLHNEFIDAIVRYGILGVTAKVAFYSYPLVYFIRMLQLNGMAHHQSVMAWMGMAVSAGFLTASLTNVNFNHNIMNVFFIVIQAYCMTGVANKASRYGSNM